MENSQWTATAAAAIILCMFASTRVSAQATEPFIPVGSLSASPTVVQTGTKPTLTWNIAYPSPVTGYIDLVPSPDGTTTVKNNIIAKVPLAYDVRVIGAGVTSTDTMGRLVYCETRAKIQVNGNTTWNIFFDGTNTDPLVQQQTIIKTGTLQANKMMSFGGCYVLNGVVGPKVFSTGCEYDQWVRTLVNGQTPPDKVGANGAQSLKNFVAPYLDASGKVKIGPMDVIVFMELTHFDMASAGCDLQDMVLLVTFKTP